MTVSGSSTELEFLYRSLNPVIIWKSAVGNCQDARTLVEEEGVTVKLVGARLGARRNASARIMKSTFYFLLLIASCTLLQVETRLELTLF